MVVRPLIGKARAHISIADDRSRRRTDGPEFATKIQVWLGISVDSPWANAEFAKKYNLEFALLSDVDRKVVNAYDATFVGLGGIEGYVSANRVIIIIDKEGTVQHRWVAENPGVEPDYDAVVAFAASL